MQRMTRRGREWLSAAADDPSACRSHWADRPREPYTLPAGRHFDVVVIGERFGMETFDQLVRRNMPVGPVAIDRAARQVGFLLPPHQRGRFERSLTSETDDLPEYRYLDEGSYVVLPGPVPLSGDRYQWLLAPLRRPETSPLRPIALAVMFAAAADLIARADRYGQENATSEKPATPEEAPAVTRAR